MLQVWLHLAGQVSILASFTRYAASAVYAKLTWLAVCTCTGPEPLVNSVKQACAAHNAKIGFGRPYLHALKYTHTL